MIILLCIATEGRYTLLQCTDGPAMGVKAKDQSHRNCFVHLLYRIAKNIEMFKEPVNALDPIQNHLLFLRNLSSTLD